MLSVGRDRQFVADTAWWPLRKAAGHILKIVRAFSSDKKNKQGLLNLWKLEHQDGCFLWGPTPKKFLEAQVNTWLKQKVS